jgi:hypothetical protein
MRALNVETNNLAREPRKIGKKLGDEVEDDGLSALDFSDRGFTRKYENCKYGKPFDFLS